MLARFIILTVALLTAAAARPTKHTKVLNTQSSGFNPPLSWNISGNTDGSTSISNFNVINAVISGNSDPYTLNNIEDYLNALGFAKECFGFHIGNPFYANLNDDQDWFAQQFELRQNIGDSVIGTCLESLFGGNHLRGYQQKDTNAWFLPISKEKDVSDHHNIATNGYNSGRDAFANAAKSSVNYGGKCWPPAMVVYEQLYPAYAGAGDTDDDQPYDGQVAIVTVEAPSNC